MELGLLYVKYFESNKHHSFDCKREYKISSYKQAAIRYFKVRHNLQYSLTFF